MSRAASERGQGGATRLPTCLVLASIVLGSPLTLQGQLMISGNENKIELTSGSPRAAEAPMPDSVSLIDFATFPPQVRHTPGISNTVIGPPSNLAIVSGGAAACWPTRWRWILPQCQIPGHPLAAFTGWI